MKITILQNKWPLVLYPDVRKKEDKFYYYKTNIKSDLTDENN